MAATDSQQTISDINALNDKVLYLKQTLDNYNGGISGSLRVAKSVYDAHTAAIGARNNMLNSDPFSDDDSQDTMDAWNTLYPNLVKTLQVGQQKVRICCVYGAVEYGDQKWPK